MVRHLRLVDTYHTMFFLSTRALFSSKKLLTSVIFFSLKMFKELAFNRIIGAVEEQFCSDTTTDHLMSAPRK